MMKPDIFIEAVAGEASFGLLLTRSNIYFVKSLI